MFLLPNKEDTLHYAESKNGEVPQPINGGRGRVCVLVPGQCGRVEFRAHTARQSPWYACFTPPVTTPTQLKQMKRLATWLIAAEVVVLHTYELWHLIRVLFFNTGCR